VILPSPKFWDSVGSESAGGQEDEKQQLKDGKEIYENQVVKGATLKLSKQLGRAG